MRASTLDTARIERPLLPQIVNRDLAEEPTPFEAAKVPSTSYSTADCGPLDRHTRGHEIGCARHPLRVLADRVDCVWR